MAFAVDIQNFVIIYYFIWLHILKISLRVLWFKFTFGIDLLDLDDHFRKYMKQLSVS